MPWSDDRTAALLGPGINQDLGGALIPDFYDAWIRIQAIDHPSRNYKWQAWMWTQKDGNRQNTGARIRFDGMRTPWNLGNQWDVYTGDQNIWIRPLSPNIPFSTDENPLRIRYSYWYE